MTNKEEEEKLDPMEITSPRTAESPGPKKQGDECCHDHSSGSHSHTHDHGDHGHDHDHSHGEGSSYWPVILSLVLLLGGIALDFFDASFFSGYVRLLVYAIAYVLVGWKVVVSAVKNISKGSIFNEFFLMGIATLGAFYIGQYAEGVAVMLFYVVGEHFQEAAVLRARKSIKDLLDNRPEIVTLLQDGKAIEIDPRKVKPGDVIQIKAGDKIALDGELLSESSSFNTAALTGESKPDTKYKGEKILAGMINLDKVIELKVTSAFEDSTLSKILTLTEQATSRKAKTQQFITRFAKVYTPIVVLLAISLTLLPYFFVEHYIFNDWLYRALIFLVISCPCALVISIPLGYFGGIGAASKNGILFKGSNFLDLITKVDTVVFDKTGTITKGVFKVQSVEVKEDVNLKEFLSLVAALESKSGHPIAKALVEYAEDDYKKLNTTDVEEIAGHGLKGKVDGKELLVGNAKLLERFAIVFPEEIKDIKNTVVLAAIEGRYAGYMVIGDELKDDADAAMKALRNLGIKHLVMLSGDKQSIVEDVARQVNIDQPFGALLPQDKVAQVEALKRQNRTVAFAGDGINDAPVIALSDVGIAMGALGSDVAIETADVVIQADQPSKIATAILIGKATNKIVWQNIGLAFGVKILVLALGAGGLATMWEAVFADVGVAFLAILNAVRIQHMKF